MTALIIAACILGYLLVGVVAARALVWKFHVFRLDDQYGEGDAGLGVLVVLFWLPVLPFALLGGFVHGLYRLIVLPPSRLRREQRCDRLAAEIRRLEAELGVGGDR